MVKLIAWLAVHRKKVIKAVLSILIGLLLCFSVNTYKHNKVLSEQLELALNNIEAYQGSLLESWLANNVLKLDIKQLKNLNDKLLQDIDSVRKELSIKPKLIQMAATQNLRLSVINSKEVHDIIEVLKDTIYTDSIKYNDLTTVHYSVGTDSIKIKLDINNTLYFYIYNYKEYKNKKNFFKRLFTLDFKKVKKYKYKIVNTNELFDISDVRVVENN